MATFGRTKLMGVAIKRFLWQLKRHDRALEVEPAHQSDQQAAGPMLDQLTRHDRQPDAMYADSGYGQDDCSINNLPPAGRSSATGDESCR